MQKSRGFTLIEVVLVAVILVILLAAAVPRFQQTALRLRAEQAAYDLSHSLRLARQRAIAEGHEVIWAWDRDTRRARIASASDEAGAGECSPAAGWALASARLPDGVTVLLTQRDQTVECVRFSRDGTVDRSTVAMTILEQRYEVMVDAATGQAGLPTRAAAP